MEVGRLVVGKVGKGSKVDFGQRSGIMKGDECLNTSRGQPPVS